MNFLKTSISKSRKREKACFRSMAKTFCTLHYHYFAFQIQMISGGVWCGSLSGSKSILVSLTYLYRWFDRFIMFCIFINAIVLSLFDYTDRDSQQRFNRIMNFVSDGFTIIFLVECWLKIIAMGFVLNKYAYLRQTWNIVDLIIVLTGYFY